MRRIVISILVVSGLTLVGLYGLIIVASESGEVVVLTTTDANGETHSTRLWIVEHDGMFWIRSGSPQSSWFKRIQRDPEGSATYAGENFKVNAVLDPPSNTIINELMRSKYGWADRVIDTLMGRDDAVAIRLEISP